jgi:rRNA maturation RNase YbeY
VISYHFICPSLHLPFPLLSVNFKKLALLEGFSLGDVNFIFCNNTYIYHLNVSFLNHHYPTDVITFDYCRGFILSGDIFIGVDVVRKNAIYYGASFSDELNRVMIHGLLHLCGYKDKVPSEKILMRGKENFYIKLFNYT